MTLTSDLFLRIIVSLVLLEIGIPNLECECILVLSVLNDLECRIPFSCHCDLDL